MNVEELVKKKCVPCEGGKALGRDEATTYARELKDWKLDEDGKSISRDFTFDSFPNALLFVNCVAHLAEEEGHHPDMYIFYTKVSIKLYTHDVGGLSINDFILAAKLTRDCLSR
jgi:4a-hydroxytetrahydrobiopterin dehydratase